jgi:hypothetical protein
MRSLSFTSLLLKWLSLGCGLANVLANLAVLLAGDLILSTIGAPLPADRYTFAAMACLSLTMGVAILYAARAPDRNLDLFKVAAFGKTAFALTTLHFAATAGLHWFWTCIGAFDGLFAVVFLLQLVRSSSADLTRYQQGTILPALPRPATQRALIFTFSLTGTGRAAVQRLQAGLERTGYRVDIQELKPLEPIFRFPMSLADFTKIVVRALFRVPAKIAPLRLPADHPYDLLIVEGQTWLVGTAAPVEAIFNDPDNLGIFAGRDAAALVVCRGTWRRNVAMLVRRLQASGANVVGARGFGHQGREPARLFRLWFYLIGKGKGIVREHYGLSEQSLAEIEAFGQLLGRRPQLQTSAPPLRIDTPGERPTDIAA